MKSSCHDLPPLEGMCGPTHTVWYELAEKARGAPHLGSILPLCKVYAWAHTPTNVVGRGDARSTPGGRRKACVRVGLLCILIETVLCAFNVLVHEKPG